MGLFSGIGNASMSFGANYARAGKYLMFIRQVKEGKNRKGVGFVAIEKKCIEVIQAQGDEPHFLGEEMTDMLMRDKDSFLPNFKAFVFKAMGDEIESPDEITEEVCDLITSDAQPLRGRVVEVENIGRIGKKSKQPYTLKKYLRLVPTEELLERFTGEQLAKILTAEEMEILGGAEPA